MQGKDFLINAPLGGFSSTMIQHDIFYKKFDTFSYNYFDNREKEKHESATHVDHRENKQAAR